MVVAENNRLGKGLGAIFGEEISSVLEDIQQGASSDFGGTKTSVSIKDIRTNPYQPRVRFNEDKLDELTDSIRKHGLFTPILVRKSDNGYELVAGERRLRASERAEYTEIEAIVVDFDDAAMMEIAIIENVQRENLNVIEEASGYKLLIDRLDLTQEDVAKRMSKSRSHVANLLRLLRLPESVQTMVLDNKLTMGQVRPLITLEDPKEIERIAQEIFDKKLSVRDTEKRVKYHDEPEKEKPNKVLNDTYKYAINLFEKKLQTRVAIEAHKITLNFEDDDDLNRIMELLDIIE